MIKAKTSKKIFAILSAVISAVFAVIIGGTYCATSLNLRYKTNPNTTTVYAMNNHYHVNNDTLINPVLFGSGSHNFEISFEYDVPYDFDLRLKYTMRWIPSGRSTDNVIINYANRDNLVIDQNYIYLASTVTDKQGKINIITGVDFVDPTNKDYYGERLTIEIVDVKVCEKVVDYDGDHPLVVESSQAADMWLKIKEHGTSNSAMVYNYRYDHAHGASFPGDDTAYYKVIEKQTNNGVTYNVVQAATWSGGNRAYAGVGMYVYAGTNLTLDVEVRGIWRLDNTDTTTDAISEAGIKFNYAEGFEHHAWDNSKLWETMKFKYQISAGTSRYINILDSMEITTPALNQDGLKKDSYRAICQSIKINGGEPLEYSEGNGDLSIRTIAPTSSSIATSTTAYPTKAVEAINSTSYLGGLYQIQNAATTAQDYATDISLVNNTSAIQQATATMKLRYRISNDNRSLTTTDGSTNRVEELLPAGNATGDALELIHKNRLAHGTLFYTFSPAEVLETKSVTVTIAPYSSVNVLNYYSVGTSLQTDIVAEYGNYDVWLYYEVTVSSSTVTNLTNLQIETRQNGDNVDIYAKNNTSKVATIESIDLGIKEKIISYKQPAETNKPNDWLATFWQYHNDADFKQNTSTVFTAGIYHLKEQAFETRTLSSTVSSGTLQPGESLKIGTVSVSGTKDLIFTGGVTASLSDLTNIVVSNAGTQEAVIINGTNNSVYIRIAGALSSQNKNDRLVASGSYIYYIGILRPGQKICVNMTSGAGTISTLPVGNEYTSTTLSSWNDNAITAKFNSLFNTEKTAQT